MGCGCAPCAASGAPCAITARALRGDPAARKLLELAGHTDPTLIGGILPDVVWPSDVRALKLRLDPSMRATDAAVATCTALEPGEKQAWQVFYLAWRVWFETPEPLLLGASPQWDNTKRIEAQLADWQAQLRQKCPIPGPIVEDETKLDLSGLKWVAAAVIVAAAAYAVVSVRTIVK